MNDESVTNSQRQLDLTMAVFGFVAFRRKRVA